MSDMVYIVTEDVQYEHTRIKGVYGSRDAAIKAVREFAESHRYSGDWKEWENEDPHVLSLQNRDVTFVVKWHFVEGGG